MKDLKRIWFFVVILSLYLLVCLLPVEAQVGNMSKKTEQTSVSDTMTTQQANLKSPLQQETQTSLEKMESVQTATNSPIKRMELKPTVESNLVDKIFERENVIKSTQQIEESLLRKSSINQSKSVLYNIELDLSTENDIRRAIEIGITNPKLGKQKVEISNKMKQELENADIPCRILNGVSEFQIQGDENQILATGYQYLYWDPDPNYFLPDLNGVWVSWGTGTAPVGATVTSVEYRLWVGEEDAGQTDFYCMDYIISISSGQHGQDYEYCKVWDHDGLQTDNNEDDDVENDYDVYLNWRTTSLFNGEDANQEWYAFVGDFLLGGDGNINYIEMRVYWETVDPDLTSPYTAYQTPPAIEGQNYWIRPRIVNEGGSTAGASHVRLFLSTDNDFDWTDDHEVLPKQSVPSLAPAGEDNPQWDFTFPDLGSGTYDVWIVTYVDCDDEVAESDENNVWKTNDPITVSDPPADLTCPSIDAQSSEVTEGDAFWMRPRIQNDGQVTAGASSARMYLSTDNDFDPNNGDEPLDIKTVPGLNAGSYTYLQWDLSSFPDLGSGDYSVWLVVEVDYYDDVIESNENNIYKRIGPITVHDTPVPDIDVSPLSLEIYESAQSAVTYSQEYLKDHFITDHILKTGYVPGRVIVKFRSDISVLPQMKNDILSIGVESVDAVGALYGVNSTSKIFQSNTSPLLSNVYLMKFDLTTDVNEVLEAYRNDPNVDYAEPDYAVRINDIPNDPSYSQQWDMDKIQAPQAWDLGQGSSNIIIGIIDSGVDWDHPDLGANIWDNIDEIPGNGLDDDGNGYVDDVRGWDFVESMPSVGGPYPGEDGDTADNNPMDFDGHGTHCSGIASAVTNNSIGVAGIGRGCNIMPLRAGGKHSDGLGYIYFSYAASAIEYAKNNGARVISMSFGGGTSTTLRNAAIDAYNNNLVVFHAAGNGNSDSPSYLDDIPETISVAATNSSDVKASFSNYGTWIDVSAPGVSIYNTYFDDTYTTLSGTSMSTPLTAGLAGLILSQNSGLSSSEVTDIIVNSTDNIDSQNPNYLGQLGSGRINAFKALQSISATDAFTISNVGGGILDVTSIVSNLPWLSFNPSVPPTLNIAAGESRAITCVVNWNDVDQIEQANVTIESNDQDVNVAVTAYPVVDFSISGYVLEEGSNDPVDGVTMNGLPDTPVTNTSGYYEAMVSSGWSGTATPSKSGWTFNPPSLNYSNVTTNFTNQDYTGTPPPTDVSISGYVRESGTNDPVEGVTLNGFPGTPVTNASGYYEAIVPVGWGGTVFPDKIGWTFDPTSRLYGNIISDLTDQNYTGTYDPNEIAVWINDDLSSPQGMDIEIPINVDDLTNLNVYSYEGVIHFDPAVLQARNPYASSDGTISSSWGSPTANSPNTSTINFGGFGTSPLSGSGTIINLLFTVVGDPGSETDITFESFVFNAGDPAASTDGGHFTVSSNFNISGLVNYCTPITPFSLASVTLDLSGSVTDSRLTGPDGLYTFTDLPAGQDYTVTPSKTDDIGALSIGMFDASIIARAVVGLIELTPCQFEAADVDNNVQVMMYDAACVATWVVQNPINPQVGTWEFEPVNRSYLPLNGDQTNQDYDGVLLGDVDGNWTPATANSLAKGAVTIEEYPFAPDLKPVTGQVLSIPLEIAEGSNLYSAFIELEYPDDMLEYQDVMLTEASSDFNLVINDAEAGILRAGLYGVKAITESAVIAELQFKVKGKPGDFGSVWLKEFQLNADQPQQTQMEFKVYTEEELILTDYALLQNYPNPFNPTTTIRYNLTNKEASRITMRIYGSNGALIRTLVDEEKTAGFYSVIWDGLNDNSNDVSSGIYYYQIRVADFMATKKLLKLK